MPLVWIVPISGVLSILFVAYLAWDVLRRDTGTPKMQEVGGFIYKGAVTFLNRQYRTIAVLAVITAVILTALIGLFERFPEIERFRNNTWELGLRTGIAFLVGAAASALSGIIGMYVAVRSNGRVASVSRQGVGPALTTALKGGAVSGFLVVGLSLIGVSLMFLAYGGLEHPEEAPFLIVGMGFGASFVALFAQLGGGIYTKAADIGADLVGKVEVGIPEDDPRNAAVVADLVGDNVGDCAGRGADLFESTVAENIGAMILGVAIFAATRNPVWILFPLVVRAFGLIASMVGILVVHYRPGEAPMDALNRGYYVALILSAIFLLVTTQAMLGSLWFFIAGLIGLLTSLAFVYITMYYTEARFRPVKLIADASRTGYATNFLSGISMGFENTALVSITVGLALLASFWAGGQWALSDAVTLGLDIPFERGGIFGTAVATMGMLMTAAYILAMDTFGPIVDNAGGIVQMAGAPAEVRAGVDALDAAGNTTKALTKGYAIGSAALAAFLLFSAYLDKVELVRRAAGIASSEVVVDLGDVSVFVGAILGLMLVFLFSSLAIQAVSRTAQEIILEVRRQFREIPGLLEGKAQADYARAVDITTRGALRNMVLPGLLPVVGPVAVGVFFRLLGEAQGKPVGAEAVAALLMVGTIGGIVLATVLNNSGAAWDNAKKWIEAGNLGGKGSEPHKVAVVGDTVGDPFKDTAGPSLHVLIKLLSTITLVLAPLFV